ncbi:MAG: OPT family oligopeptide transporter [Gemmataceae bacterium]
MATTTEPVPAKALGEPVHKPFVPDSDTRKEFTFQAVLVGAFLGIIFGASSLYLVLKVGITVSASIPVAVLSITLFRALGRIFPFMRATILENNIVQTTGSAGESIAFGVGVTMPALMLLGFDLSIGRVMVVAILGGVLGILMMIPLRRAFIVKLHPKKMPPEPGELLYPEGTACAEVLKAGEGTGGGGGLIFAGFGLAFAHKFLTEGMNLLNSTVRVPLGFINRAASFAGEMASELLGVGYIIGFRTSAIMMAGAVLGYLVIIPIIAMVGDHVTGVVPPGTKPISQMSVNEIRNNYLLFIGAGCVAAAGIISMCKTLPMIVKAILEGVKNLRGTNQGAAGGMRTEKDMSMQTVLFGSFVLLVILAAFLYPDVGLGGAILGAVLVLIFGFLFVTVSSRLTGEIGSTSNPISGMTVAALLMTCLIFLALRMTSPLERVLALSIGGVVCIAASNGGTTSQDLKTGFLLGATPRKQQYAIIIGALTSAVVIGFTLLLFNDAKTIRSDNPEHYPRLSEKATKYLLDPQNKQETTTRDGLKLVKWIPGEELTEKERERLRATGARPANSPTAYWVEIVDEMIKVKDEEGEDTGEKKMIKVGRVRYLVGGDLAERKVEDYQGQPYRIWWAVRPDFPGNPVRMLVQDDGRLAVRVDQSIMGQLTERKRPDGTTEEVKREFEAPKTQVMGLIINGVLQQDLNWSMVLIGALIAVMLELCGISALAFAVGVYVPIQYSTPIFIGGSLRWLIERFTRKPASGPTDEAAAIAKEETSPAVLLSSGYIAGGSLAGMLVAFLEFYDPLKRSLDVTKAIKTPVEEQTFFERIRQTVFDHSINTKLPMNKYWVPLAAFGVLIAVLLAVGLMRKRSAD